VSAAQYRVVVGKKDERVEGDDPGDDADGVVFSVPIAVAAAGDFDAAVEFMRGRLKATGHTGRVFDVLRSGEATAALSRLASQP
jgi:hypothetical protein